MQIRLILSVLLATSAACDSPGGGTSSLLPDLDVTIADSSFLDGHVDGHGPGADLPLAEVTAPDVAPDTAGELPPQQDAVADVAHDADADTVTPPDVSPDAQPGLEGVVGGGVVLSEVDSPFVNVAAAVARFVAKDPAPPAGTSYGPCLVAMAGPSVAPPVARGFDAGTISATGTTPAVTLTASSEGATGTGYTSSLPESLEDLLPAGGGLITVKGAGGADIPAFTAVVQAPEAVALKSPAITFNLSTSASADFTFTWNAGAGDPVVVNITPVGSDYKPVDGLEILCTAEPGATSLTVPKGALAAMLAGAASRTAVFGVTRAKRGTGAAGSLTVGVGATRSTGGPLRIDK